MVRLEEHKTETENKAIERIFLPVKVYISLSQHSGRIANPEVKICGMIFAKSFTHEINPSLISDALPLFFIPL